MIEFRPSALKALKLKDYLVRFAFGGACSVLAGIIATHYGAAIGGLFLAFPAIFPAGASLIENQEREKKQRLESDGKIRGRMAAGSDAAGAAMGCVGLALFGLLAIAAVQYRVLYKCGLRWLGAPDASTLGVAQASNLRPGRSAIVS